MPPQTRDAAAGERKRSGSGSGSGSIPTKLRRAHRKSRNGCLECKRRHIKCDEARPTCSNCVVSDRSCSFPSTATPSTAQTPASTPATFSSHAAPSIANDSQVQSPAGSCPSPAANHHPYIAPTLSSFSNAHFGLPMAVDDQVPFPTTLPSFTEAFSTTTSADSLTSTSPDDISQPLFTAKHLILLHHAITNMALNDGHMRPVIEMAVEWSQEAPYAVCQLLSLAADHIAFQSNRNDESYRRIATELQTRALMGFNHSNQNSANATEEDREKHCVPQFIFASLLSIQILYETFANYRANFHVFIEKFLESVYVHRGVRTITSPIYNAILKSRLSQYLLNVRQAEEGAKHTGTECTELIHLIEASDLAPSSITACKSAAETLQWAFNVHANLPARDNSHAATAFPVLLAADFMDNIRKHRPEGLIVLAYYGVLLHRCRNSWVIGDAGSFLVRLIADYLGAYWQEPMRWPLAELDRKEDEERG